MQRARGTYDSHMSTIAHQSVNLIMDRFQTVICAWRVRDPALVTKMFEFPVHLKDVHKPLTVGGLRLKDLSRHCVITTGSRRCFR